MPLASWVHIDHTYRQRHMYEFGWLKYQIHFRAPFSFYTLSYLYDRLHTRTAICPKKCNWTKRLWQGSHISTTGLLAFHCSDKAHTYDIKNLLVSMIEMINCFMYLSIVFGQIHFLMAFIAATLCKEHFKNWNFLLCSFYLFLAVVVRNTHVLHFCNILLNYIQHDTSKFNI